MEIQDDEQNENKVKAGANASTSGPVFSKALKKTSPPVDTPAPAPTLSSFCSSYHHGDIKTSTAKHLSTLPPHSRENKTL